MTIQGVLYPSDFEAKKAMIEYGRRMEAAGCAIAGDGSLSVRVGPNALWISEKGADKGTLTQEKFIRVDLGGRQMMSAHPRALPEDLPLHLRLYTENTALRCVLHAYPPRVAAMQQCGCGVEAAAFAPSVRALGAVPTLAAAAPEAQAAQAAQAARTAGGAMLMGDGCLLWGDSPAQAYQRLQAIEYYASVWAAVRQAGAAVSCGAVQPAAPACTFDSIQAVPAAPVPAAMDGLTPMVRPGESGGFRLPHGGEKPEAAPAASAPIRPAAPSVPLTARPAAPVIRPAQEPQPGAPAPGSVPVKDAPREQVMAEVVRRKLAQMR